MRVRYSILVFLAGAGLAIADDGSWSESRGYTPAEGALYAEEGNQDITLEKEYLELSDYKTGTTRAVFQFRNTARKAVTVECAFPIKLVWNVPELSGSGEGAGWYFGETSRYGPRYPNGPFNDTIDNWLQAFGSRGATNVTLEFEDEPNWEGKFLAQKDYPTGRKDFKPNTFLGADGSGGLISLDIKQDGKPVALSNCVVDFGNVPGRITLHFRHQLAFAAGAVSRVEVNYAFPAGESSSGDPYRPGSDNTYSWDYILETGASWKEPIGSLVLAVPPDFRGELPAPFKPIGISSIGPLFLANAWEPTGEQNLRLTWIDSEVDTETMARVWKEFARDIDLESAANPEPGVQVLGASSSLPDKADVFVRGGIIRSADFGAERLFDGLRETAWVEGKAGDGIGEYVAFSVDRSMNMMAVQNGYLRSTVDFPEKATWSYFEKNNRVKVLQIEKNNGDPVAGFDLADTRDFQYFMLDLPPGSYRAVIKEVYPGTKWKDTCLGELRFFPGPINSPELGRLAGDPFFEEFVSR